MDKVSRLPAPTFNKVSFGTSLTKSPSLPPCGMRLHPRERQSCIEYHKNDPKFSISKDKRCSVETVATPTPAKPPEIHFCEACELEFYCVEDLKIHRLQHEKCPIGDCKFRGHPTIMDKHITELHTTGLFDKCKKLSTPEEIAAWREERRKRYPTLANVMQKQKALEQKLKRGERIEPDKSRFGKVGNQNKHAKEQHQKRTRNHKRKSRRKFNKKADDIKEEQSTEKSLKCPTSTSKKLKKDEQSESDSDDEAGINMFRGTSRMKDYIHKSKREEKPANALNCLLGAYASTDSDYSKEDICSEHELNDMSSGQLSSDSSQMENNNQSNSKIEDDPENNFLTKTEDDVAPSESAGVNSLQIEDLSDEGPEECPIIHDESNFQPQLRTKDDVNVKPIESTEKSKQISEKNALHSNPIVKHQIGKRRFNLAHSKPARRPNTMLAKLLEADIRHERNVLLQCVRYVCENNFFHV